MDARRCTRPFPFPLSAAVVRSYLVWPVTTVQGTDQGRPPLFPIGASRRPPLATRATLPLPSWPVSGNSCFDVIPPLSLLFLSIIHINNDHPTSTVTSSDLTVYSIPPPISSSTVIVCSLPSVDASPLPAYYSQTFLIVAYATRSTSPVSSPSLQPSTHNSRPTHHFTTSLPQPTSPSLLHNLHD